ncbi:MAG: YeeE/YedE thiosulfate transporter family protein [Luteolibacter sp.]
MKTAAALLFLGSLQAASAAERVALASEYDGAAWSPYLVGAAIGVLSWLTFYFADKSIGASSFYAALAGFIGKAISPAHIAKLHYFRKNPPKIGWGFVFVIATVIGGFLAASTGGEIRNEWLHPMWTDHFGENSMGQRLLTAILGGALMAFGARLAGGCTSGHGISGTLQLNLGSWLTAGGMFIGGIIVAKLFFLIA